MRIVDKSDYIELKPCAMFLVLACFSKAIYCQDQADGQLICITSDSIAISTISIRIKGFDILMPYLHNKMLLKQAVQIQSNSKLLSFDGRWFFDVFDMKTIKCHVPFYESSEKVEKYYEKSLIPFSSQLGTRAFDFSMMSKGKFFEPNALMDIEHAFLDEIFKTGLGQLLPLLLSPRNPFFALSQNKLSRKKTIPFPVELLLTNLFFYQFRQSDFERTDKQGFEYNVLKASLNGWHFLHLGLSQSNLTMIELGIRQLIGQGEGLTPSGDDFLIGILLIFRLLNKKNWVSQMLPLIETASSQTNKISRQFLVAAIEGFFSPTLFQVASDLLESIVEKSKNLKNAHDSALNNSLKALRQIGHSSGVDALVGVVFGLSLVVWNELYQSEMN